MAFFHVLSSVLQDLSEEAAVLDAVDIGVDELDDG